MIPTYSCETNGNEALELFLVQMGWSGNKTTKKQNFQEKVKPNKCTVQGPEYLENERAESRVS